MISLVPTSPTTITFGDCVISGFSLFVCVSLQLLLMTQTLNLDSTPIFHKAFKIDFSEACLTRSGLHASCNSRPCIVYPRSSHWAQPLPPAGDGQKIAVFTENRAWQLGNPRVAILLLKMVLIFHLKHTVYFYLENIYLAVRNTSTNHYSLKGLGSGYTPRHHHASGFS